MRHLFSCLKRYRKEVFLSPLFKLLEACMELTVPLVVAKIVNVGIAGGDRGYVINACLLLIGFGALGLGFALTAQYFAARAATGVSAELRKRLFHKLQSLSFSQIDELGTSTMITRMTSDVNQVQSGVNMFLRIILRSPFIVFGAMALAFVVDSEGALVFAGVIPLLIIAIYAVMGLSIPLYRKAQERLDRVYLSTRENLSGVRVIRAFSLEEKEVSEFDRRNESLKRAQKGAGRISALMNPLTYVLINVAVVVLLYICAQRVDLGILAQGEVIALYGYLAQILVELIKMTNLIVTVSKAISSQKRIGKVLDLPAEPQTTAEPQEKKEGNVPAVQFCGVTFAYRGGGAPALENIDLCVKRGETVGILGGTGSGKSTLVGLIPRFYETLGGEILVDGENVNAIPYADLRARVGMVPQKAVLFKGTIRSNLLWGNGQATDEELMEAVRLAQAEDILSAKGGLDGEVAQEGKNFSGGQRQRLTIARALVRKPKILILDDASSALDYATERNLRAALRTLDCTVFLVSQRATSVRHADKILVLEDGRAEGLGTHEELLESCAVYREIYLSQTKEEA